MNVVSLFGMLCSGWLSELLLRYVVIFGVLVKVLRCFCSGLVVLSVCVMLSSVLLED